MATIVNNSKSYGEGHEIILKDKISGSGAQVMRKNGYLPGNSKFKITLKKGAGKKIQLTEGKASVMLIDKNNKRIQINGSESSINTLFNHFTQNAKSDTNLLTEIKETFSKVVFEEAIERNKRYNEEDLKKLVTKIIPKTKDNYDTLYYESAYKQLKALKTFVTRKGYEYERQGGIRTKALYVLARKLTGKLNDNWNPADVWMVHKNYNMKPLLESKTSEELNTRLAKAYNAKDLIGISLKQVDRPSAKASTIDPAKLMNAKLDLNLKFDKINLSESFNNFIVITKSNFAIRAGFKASATTLNVSLEGRFTDAGYQTGAVDAVAYKKFVQENYKFNLRSSAVVANDYPAAKRELKSMFSKYGRLSDKIQTYKEAIDIFDQGDKLTQDRFANLMSYMHSFLTAPKSFEKHMQFCYLTSKKLTSDSGLYLIIKNA